MIPETLLTQLADFGITEFDEVALRQALEAHVPTYTLIKLADWPARRWKCRYRLMLRDVMYDAQNASEAYALALLAAFQHPPTTQASGEQPATQQ